MTGHLSSRRTPSRRIHVGLTTPPARWPAGRPWKPRPHGTPQPPVWLLWPSAWQRDTASPSWETPKETFIRYSDLPKPSGRREFVQSREVYLMLQTRAPPPHRLLVTQANLVAPSINQALWSVQSSTFKPLLIMKRCQERQMLLMKLSSSFLCQGRKTS